MGKSKLRTHFYKSNLKQAKKRVPFDKIPGPTPKPAWNSPAACGLAHSTIDLETAAWCDREFRWDALEDAWWCCLYRAKRIIVKHLDAEQWYLSLGDAGQAGLGWPVNMHVHSGGRYTFFAPSAQAGAKVQFMHMGNPDEWEACSFSWASPPEQFLMVNDKCKELEAQAQSLHLIRQGEACPIMDLAAKSCFWDFPQILARKILKVVGKGLLEQGGTFFDVLSKLVKVAPGCSDDQLANIMTLRHLKPQTQAQDLSDLDDASEVLEQEALRDFKKAKEDMLTQEEELTSYKAKRRPSYIAFLGHCWRSGGCLKCDSHKLTSQWGAGGGYDKCVLVHGVVLRSGFGKRSGIELRWCVG